jgi:ribosome biogenesis GTPase / thiamine phosphate phosphatase
MLLTEQDLSPLSWSPEWINDQDTSRKRGVIIGHRSQFYYIVSGSEHFTCQLSGKLKFDADTKSKLPVVGDWVMFESQSSDQTGVIFSVAPRKSTLSRKLVGDVTDQQLVAANIDKVILVVGADQDFNLARIERYLTAIHEGGATPLLLINKMDRCEDIESLKEELSRINGLEPMYTIALSGTGLETLTKKLIDKESLVFVGSSGVGKSTIINALSGKEIAETGEVREGDGKGRHTTTHREMYKLANGSLVIDSPGIRELQLWGDGEGLDESFKDILAIANRCKFSDCKHINEPGCAIQQAIVDNVLDAQRVANYQKQATEIKDLTLKKKIRSRKKDDRYFSRERKKSKYNRDSSQS